MDVSLMQLQMLVLAVETGSISAAAKRLHRVPSAVSQGIATLEDTLGLQLFDRGGRRATPTPLGVRMAREAEAVLGASRRIEALASRLAGGMEPVVSVVVDVMLDIDDLVPTLRDFGQRWPEVQLLVHSEALDAVAARVLDGTCTVGVGGPIADLPRELDVHGGWSVDMLPVAAPDHPLTACATPISTQRLREHTQIVLTHRSDQPGADHFVVAEQRWRVADLRTKRAFIMSGLGWGSLPVHMIEDDLCSGRLVRIRPEPWERLDGRHWVAIVTHPERPPGPAARWIVERLMAKVGQRGTRSDANSSPAPS